ncbi:MAG: hypothetical protein RLY31_1455 [Bacteroidota bacterium]|jgi:hypothetical protein
MKRFPYFLLLFGPLGAAIAGLSSCASPPDYPLEPYIEFVSLSKDTMQRGQNQEDSVFVTFRFTDGDGDIGNNDTLDLFLTDLRTQVLERQFRIPAVPKLGASNGIKGEIRVRLLPTCCIFPPDLGLNPCMDETPLMPYDQVSYELFVRDRSGNASNSITVGPIFIRCFG